MSNLRPDSPIGFVRLLFAVLLPVLLLGALAGADPALAATPTSTPPPPTPRRNLPAAAPTATPTGAPVRATPVRATPVRATPAPSAAATVTPTAAQAAALAAAGQKVYLKNYCGVCHVLTAAGTRGMFGPPHDHIAATAVQRLADPNYGGTATTAAEYLRESIVDPKAYAAGGYTNTPHPMPPYAHLPQADIDALVFFLLQQQ